MSGVCKRSFFLCIDCLGVAQTRAFAGLRLESLLWLRTQHLKPQTAEIRGLSYAHFKSVVKAGNERPLHI